MKNMRIINRLWPIGGVHEEEFVDSKMKGKCLQCGRCCALIRIPIDHEFLRENRRQYIREAFTSGDPMTEAQENWIRDGIFILNHWTRISRFEAVRRGFTEKIDAKDFFFTCDQLSHKGKCKSHGKFKPEVCHGYPHYKNKDPKNATRVFKGCGWARKRKRPKKHRPPQIPLSL